MDALAPEAVPTAVPPAVPTDIPAAGPGQHCRLWIELADGRRVAFDTAPPGDPDATCFLLGIRKCGSSIMNSMVSDLARLNHRHYLDIAGGFFHANIPERLWRNDPAAQRLLVPGQVHGGFRAMPLIFAEHPVYRAARKILLVRDPRDALVSEYFSNAYSHSLPQQEAAAGATQDGATQDGATQDGATQDGATQDGATQDGATQDGATQNGATQDMLALRQSALTASLEAYVLRQAPALARTFLEYRAAAEDPRTRLFRYEDVILAKRPWMQNVAAQFGWQPIPEDVLDGMMGWADIVPEQEQPERFIRKVMPGDHREKLSADVIAQLNDVLSPAMRMFGYT